MDFEPSDAQAAVAATARAFAQERLAPAAAANDRQARFPVELIRGLGELGLLAVTVSAESGGSEVGAVAYALALMEIAAVDCAVAVSMAVTNLAADTIARFGTEEQKQRCLPRLASAEWLAGAFALSEPHGGSDAAAMRTRGERRGDRWVINGSKQWITSGDRAGVFVVWAMTDLAAGHRGITAFLVRGGTPGLSVAPLEEKMGLHGSSTAQLVLDGVEVGDDAVLGGVGGGFRLAMMALSRQAWQPIAGPCLRQQIASAVPS